MVWLCQVQVNIESENPFPIHSLPRVSSNSTSYYYGKYKSLFTFYCTLKHKVNCSPTQPEVVWYKCNNLKRITSKFCWKCASCFCPGVLLVVLKNKGGQKSSNDFWNMPYIHLVCSSLFDIFFINTSLHTKYFSLSIAVRSTIWGVDAIWSKCKLWKLRKHPPLVHKLLMVSYEW